MTKPPAWVLVLSAVLGLATAALVTATSGVDPLTDSGRELRGPASAGALVSGFVLFWGALSG